LRGGNNNMPVHHWASLSWPAFRALPARHRIAVLPMGALEAHGPHLPLGTDIVIAEAMARAGAARLSRRGFDAVLLPALPFAPAPFAASFEGTIDTAAAATTTLLIGIARSAARHGARATVVANAHHDPAHVAAIRDAVRQAETDKSARIIFPDLTRRRWASRLTAEFQSGACHAGRYEGSVVLAAEPHLVDAALMSTLPANTRSLVDAIQSGRATFAEAGGPDAYFGSPAEATAEEGRTIIDRLGAILEEAVVEEFPAPPGAGPGEPAGGVGVVR
jgi:creatinine amidohydrolase